MPSRDKERKGGQYSNLEPIHRTSPPAPSSRSHACADDHGARCKDLLDHRTCSAQRLFHRPSMPPLGSDTTRNPA